MTARPNFEPHEQLTIEEFLAFTATRPDGERWELIEGVAIMNASPVNVHQIVTGNIYALLLAHKRASGAAWLPSLGIGTRVPISPRSLPQPDVFVQEGPASWSHITDDALVIFEVLSRSNTKADRDWRRKVYASVPNCRHYVTVSLTVPEMVGHDRATGWKARSAKGLDVSLTLEAIGFSLPLADVYRYTPLGSD